MADPFTTTGSDWFSQPTPYDLSIPAVSAGFSGMDLVSPSVIPNLGQAGRGGLFGGLSMDQARLGLAGISTLGGLWGAFQQANLAKKQFNYTRDVTETNLANQLKTYNTQLTDRANNRAIVEGRTPAETAAYIDANKLSRYGGR